MDKRYMTIYGTQFYVPNLKGWSRQKFFDTYKGRVLFNLDEAWQRLQKRMVELGLKKYVEVELPESPAEKEKKRDKQIDRLAKKRK